MNRKERRAQDADILKRREQFASANSGPLGTVVDTGGYNNRGAPDAGGWGMAEPGAKPAGGSTPQVNPFMIPKTSGITRTTQAFPQSYYVNWDLSTWRQCCDQAIKMGNPVSYGLLVSWAFESSAFIQSLFRTIAVNLGKIPFFFNDAKGNVLDDWTQELCNKPWEIELRKEVAHSFFWGFSGLNFDPLAGKLYKYPMGQIDPINRMLRANTYAYFDGTAFAEYANMLFIQPSTNLESFLGWMQPITRAFILMNMNKNNWVQAGARLAFPLLTVGYPQDSAQMTQDGMAQFNPFKEQAEDVAASMDPSKGLVYPYTQDNKGNIVKSLQIEMEGKGVSNRAHAIFTDFNDSEKDEIRELVLGGSLTADVGKSGSLALGEVQERKLETIAADMLEFVVAWLNDEFIPKIAQFYTNFPKDGKFDINRSKQMSVDDIVSMSTVVTQNGKRLTTAFFEANGLSKDFLEDAPDPVMGGNAMAPGSKKPGRADKENDGKSFKMAGPIEGGSGKKKY